MHMCGVQKDGTDGFIYRAAMEKQTERTDLETRVKGKRGEGERVRWMERVTWKLTIPYVK